MELHELLEQHIGTIVDVRSANEFRMAHCQGALSIPIEEMEFRLNELRALTPPLILCCASGNRSGMAERRLKALGIACINAGSWMDITHWQTQGDISYIPQ
ncbi:MAG: rhodanese-like domain-containing protein [Chitinophagaceae bacterium]